MLEEEKEKNEAVTEEEDDDEDVVNPDDYEEEDESEDEDDEGEDEESEDEDEESDEDSSEADDEEKKKEEQKAKNAKAAERRRRYEARVKAEKERKEREQKIREEATLEAELGMIKVNPYTDKPIKDAEDLKIYKLQKELDEEGLDPIEDLPQRIAERNRIAAKEAKELAEKAKNEENERLNKIQAEVKELRKKYPKLDTVELANDPLFQKCLEGRAGRWTQVEIYEFYLGEKAKEDKRKQEEKDKKDIEKAADKTNPPSSKGKGNSTNKAIDEMTPEEFERYFQEKYNS